MILEKIVDFFKMDVKATRFNWYRDSNDWKPYHHDAAAVKPDKGNQAYKICWNFSNVKRPSGCQV